MCMLTENIINFFSVSNRIEGYHVIYSDYIDVNILNSHVKNDYTMFGYLTHKLERKELANSIEIWNTIHSIIMSNLIEDEYRGTFRDIGVRTVGHIYPNPVLIQNLANALVNKRKLIKTPEDIMECHFLFEYIHPYVDGNGRTGRAIWLWDMLSHGFDNIDFLSYFSNSDKLYEQRDAYYDALEEYGKTFDQMKFLEEYCV